MFKAACVVSVHPVALVLPPIHQLSASRPQGHHGRVEREIFAESNIDRSYPCPEPLTGAVPFR